MAPSLKLTAAMRPAVSGRMTTDSFERRLPTALVSSEKSVATIFATSTAIANPPAGPPAGRAATAPPGAPEGPAGARFVV